MTNSMTGYGREQQVLHGREITVEIKSVNSRYFEYSSRLPRSMAFADDALKKAVQMHVARGKTEVHVSLQTLEGAEMSVSANIPAARGYYEALSSIANDLHIENNIKSSDFVRINEVFNLRRAEADENEMAADVVRVAQAALEKYDGMRATEGEKLVLDVAGRLAAIEEMVSEVEADTEGRMARYTEKLATRLREVLEDTTVDEARLLTEAAIFADKTAVAEETVRLCSHIAQFREILVSGGPIGRKLDFLTQELNREVNTIGSKCQEVEITKLVVEMKSEIEKIREQIQNLE